MLTPQEIKDKNFTKAVFGGYDMSGVDGFIDKIVEDFEILFKENAILKSKLKVLVEKVEEYRNTEDAMRMALLTAKKMADELVEDARKKADALLRNTESGMASKMLAVQKQVDGEERRLKAAQQVTAEFVDMSMSLCRKQVNFLQKLGELSESDMPEEEQKPETVTKAEAVTEAAKEIEHSVTRVYSTLQEDIKKADNSKAAKPKIPEGWDDDDEPTSPRPKFEFHDLKFGNNIDE